MRAVLLVVCLLAPMSAAAHEIGTTDVRLRVDRTGRWSAAITTGPLALLNKLEVAAGRTPSAAIAASELQRRLETLLPTIASHLNVRFDGEPSNPTVSLDRLDMPADRSRAAFVVLSVTGTTRPDASTVSWQDDLVYSTYALVLQHEGDAPTTIWIEADAESGPVRLSAQRDGVLAVAARYLRLGFTHILPGGLDHILFVLGLFLLTREARPLLLQVTAFTLAHSITLGLTMFGVVSLSPSIVEPLIALSIVYVAVENLVTTRLTVWRPAVVFAFGLLHGMGFAGVLRALPLPDGHFVPALVGFNGGIELAQLCVLALAFGCSIGLQRDRVKYRQRLVIPASAAIALIGLIWTVERTVRF